MLFELFGAPPQGLDVCIAAGGTCPRHRLGKAAVVATQSPVKFVKHPKCAAMRTLAFPVAI